MFTKTLLITSVLFGFLLSAAAGQCLADASTQFKQADDYKRAKQYEQAEAIYQQIVTGFPGSDDALEAQKQLTILYIRQDNQPQAEAAFQKLLAYFYIHNEIAKAVNKVADHYVWSGRYEKAKQLYQYVVDNWPQADYAIWSQKSLAASNMRLGDDPNADAAIEKLLTNFSQHKQIANAVNMLADECSTFKKYEKARRLYQYVVENCPDNELATLAQQGEAILNIKLGDDDAALDSVEKLLADFSEHKNIAKAVNKVADQYRLSKKYEKARQLYQYVVDNWPQADYAIWSQKSLAASNMRLGDDPNAEAAIEKLLATFSEHKQIANAVNMLADECIVLKRYDKARPLYQYFVENFPDNELAIWAQQGLVISNIKLGDAAAQYAVEKLLTDFSEHKQIAKAVNKAADHYRWSGKYEKARRLYQYVVDNWPEADYAIWSQKSLAVSNMRLGDEPNAAAAIETLLANYSEHKQIANAVNMLADECSMLKRYDKARELNQYVIDRRPEDKSAMQAQADLIKSYLALGNDPNAEAATDKLLTDFNDNPLIAGAVWDTAQFYRDLKKYEKANQLYQHVVDKWPKAEHAILSQMGMAEVNVLYLIDYGNDTAAREALDILIADFNDHPALHRHLFVLGEQYYYAAFRFEKERRAAEGKENFLNAITIWDRILKDLPPSPLTPETYNLVAICYDRIGKYRTAIKYYQVVLDDWPDYQHACYAQYQIGRCYQRLRDAGDLGRSEAEIMIRAAYEAVVKKYPDCSTTPAARNWLNYHKKPAEGGKK